MDELNALQQLGLTLPSPAYIVGAVLFGVVGIVAFRQGKLKQRPRTKWLGVALMLYPYLVSPTWALWAVGLGLTAAVWWDRD